MLLRLQIIGMQILIHKFCGHANAWLRNKDRAFWHGRQHTQFFPNPFCQCCSSLNTVRHIGSQPDATLHQRLHGKSQAIHLIDSPQHCCTVRAATCHTGRYRNTFLQLNGHSILNLKLIHQKLCRFVDQIILIGGQIIKIGFYLNPRRLRFTDLQIIMKPDGLHDHLHFMIAILSSAQHIQPKIDLCQRF